MLGLQRLEAAGQQTISSGQLGALLGFSYAQIRKDLRFFGQFGYPGVGYRCDELIRAMRDILGTNHRWPVVMEGVGNLGRALLGYRGFGRQNFSIVAAFDAAPPKWARRSRASGSGRSPSCRRWRRPRGCVTG